MLTKLKSKYLIGITILLSLLFFTLSKFFGLIHFNNKVLLAWTLFSCIWLIIAILSVYSIFFEKKQFLLWKEKKGTIKLYLFSVIGLFALSMILGIIKTHFESKVVMEKIVSDQFFWEQNSLLYIFMGITAGFGEELLFRGYIQPRINFITNNNWLAIILTSFLFAISHFSNSDIYKMFFLFAFGIIFSLHYNKYNNIFILGLTHCLIDIISL